MVKNESMHATSGLDYFNALLSGSEKTLPFAPLLWLLIKLQTEFISLHKQNSKGSGPIISQKHCIIISSQQSASLALYRITWDSKLLVLERGVPLLTVQLPVWAPSLILDMVSMPSDDLEPVMLICCYRLRLPSRRAVPALQTTRVHMPLLHLVMNLCLLFPVQLKHLSLQPVFFPRAVSSSLTVIVKVSSSHRSSDIKQVQNSQDIFSESDFPKAKFVNSAKIFTTVWLEIH